MYKYLLFFCILFLFSSYALLSEEPQVQAIKPLIGTSSFQDRFASQIETRFTEALASNKDFGFSCALKPLESSCDITLSPIFDSNDFCVDQGTNKTIVQVSRKTQHLLTLYRLGYILQRNPNVYKERMISRVLECLLAHINEPNTPLSQHLHLIELLENLKPPKQTFLMLLYDLNRIVMDLWALKKQYQTALELTHLMYQLNQRHLLDFQSEIALMLSSALSYLIESNDIEALLKIYPIATSFNVTFPNIRQEIPNHIADAECLYRRGEYKKAMQWIKWVLLIAPEEKRAKALYQIVLLKTDENIIPK